MAREKKWLSHHEKMEKMNKLAEEMRCVAEYLENFADSAYPWEYTSIPSDSFTRAKRRLGIIRYIFGIQPVKE